MVRAGDTLDNGNGVRLMVVNVNSRRAREMFLVLSVLSNARNLFGKQPRTAIMELAYPPLSRVPRCDTEFRTKVGGKTLKISSDAKALVVKATPIGYANWSDEAYFWFAIAFIKKIVNDNWKPHRDFAEFHGLIEAAHGVVLPHDREEKYRSMAEKFHDRLKMFGYFKP